MQLVWLPQSASPASCHAICWWRSGECIGINWFGQVNWSLARCWRRKGAWRDIASNRSSPATVSSSAAASRSVSISATECMWIPDVVSIHSLRAFGWSTLEHYLVLVICVGWPVGWLSICALILLLEQQFAVLHVSLFPRNDFTKLLQALDPDAESLSDLLL